MSLHRLRVLVMRKLSARHRGWSALERAMVCAVAWLCIPLLTPLAHADFLYHLNDVGIQAYGGGVFYSVNGMNHAGVVAGTYMIVIDQADRRAYAAGQDLDLLFNGFFGFGPTGESVYGVDTQGNVYGSVRAPQTSDTDFTPLISDFVATRSSDGSYSASLAPYGTFAGMTFDNNRVSGVDPPDISTVDNGAGWTLLDVEAKNPAGQIAGIALFEGLLHPYRLDPISQQVVPEPSSLVLSTVGGLAYLAAPANCGNAKLGGAQVLRLG